MANTKKRISDFQSFARLFDEYGIVYELSGSPDGPRAMYIKAMDKTIAFTISGYLARIGDGEIRV